MFVIMAKKKQSITVQGTEIKLFVQREEDYISLTDIAKRVNDRPEIVIQNWLRNRDTIEFLGVWEQLHNSEFKHIEFDVFRSRAGLNSFVLSPKQWIEKTGAIGLQSKSGRYGGTFAHRDIALAFCYWISPPFQLYLIKEFQRLKQIEAKEKQDALEWSVRRLLTKINYSVHTDAIKEELIPPRLAQDKTSGLVYAGEADILNLALFGMTAKEWRTQNPEAKGNIRDQATTEQLLVLANLEAINAELIRQGLSQDERVIRLNEAAITQMRSILASPSASKLPPTDK